MAAEAALSGIRVLEICNRVSAPYCTKILADYGADVIKAEKPEGDDARRAGPFPTNRPHLERSGLFLYLNTNKRSVTLDLRNQAGVKVFKDLVKHADVLVEDLEPQVLSGLGLDYEGVAQINPRVIMTSISPFGQTGPYRDYRATDLTVWALTGILSECGEADREPLKIGQDQTEYVAGLYGALATLSALYSRAQSGTGQHLDVSAWEAFHTTEPYMALMHSQLGGLVRKRAGIHWPWGIHPCRDGYIGFFFPVQAHWESLCTLLERPDLLDDPEYETPLQRDQRAAEISALISSWLEDKCMEDVFHAAQELRLPLTPVPNMAQIAGLAQHVAREFFVEIEHPEAGQLTYPGAFFKLSETPWRAGRAPLLGEHNREVYSGLLGYSEDYLTELADKGAI